MTAAMRPRNSARNQAKATPPASNVTWSSPNRVHVRRTTRHHPPRVTLRRGVVARSGGCFDMWRSVPRRLLATQASLVGRGGPLGGHRLLRALQQVPANVRPVVRQCPGDALLAASVEVADAPVELLESVLRRAPVAFDFLFELALLFVSRGHVCHLRWLP